MRGQWTAATALGLLTAFASTSAVAFDRGHADTFAVLPSGSTGPEGLTVGPDGNVYVTTFGFNAQGQVPGPSQLLVFDPRGKLLRNVSIAGSTAHTLGLAFNPVTGALIVLDFGAGTALKVNPVTGTSSAFMTAHTARAPGGSIGSMLQADQATHRPEPRGRQCLDRLTDTVQSRSASLPWLSALTSLQIGCPNLSGAWIGPLRRDKIKADKNR